MPVQVAEFLFQLFDFHVGQLLQINEAVAGLAGGADELIELDAAPRVAVLDVLNQESIRKVMMVVPVLMTSCQVSEY